MISLIERQEKRGERRKSLEKNGHLIVEQLKALGALRVIPSKLLCPRRGRVVERPRSHRVKLSSLSSKEGKVDRRIACDIIVYNEKELAGGEKNVAEAVIAPVKQKLAL